MTNQHSESDVISSINKLSKKAEEEELQGQYSEAERLYQQALETARKKLGDKHPHVDTCINNLAGLYLSQDRHSEATLLLQQSQKVKRELRLMNKWRK